MNNFRGDKMNFEFEESVDDHSSINSIKNLKIEVDYNILEKILMKLNRLERRGRTARRR